MLVTKIWTEGKRQNSPSDSYSQKTGAVGGTRATQGSRELQGISMFEAFNTLNQKKEMQKQGQINCSISEILALKKIRFFNHMNNAVYDCLLSRDNHRNHQ